ncbi:3-isopropylmalate dehydratase small subunit [Mesorhizobium sp. LCM 4577]|nr:3-isopropylmalate dehydratase small subunit [Mesorhizobium sp. LCM 4577]
MPMTKVRIVAGQPVIIDGDNIDTDQILPGAYLYKPRSEGDFGHHLFHDARYHPDGSKIVTHPLNRITKGMRSIILGDANFGCGSSREQAAWALADFGCGAVIAASFGTIFYQNCVAIGVLPVVLEPAVIAKIKHAIREGSNAPLEIDLENQTVTWGTSSCRFVIGADDRRLLMAGADAISRVDQYRSEWEIFNDNYKASMPWA